MAAGDIFRDGARGAGRLMPILLPGFAFVMGATATHGVSIFAHTFAGFLTLLLLLPFTAALLGLINQALRYVTFDWAVKLLRGDPVNEDSPDAYHYALYANLCVVWVVFTLSALFAHWSYMWEHKGRVVGYLILIILFGFALAWAAMLAYHRSHQFSKPATRKRKTTRKKTE
ncbi:MAG: hypothetical protein ACYTF8_01415 [Planctomycetota bacterium]|jgi:hypothetical protein